MIVGSKRMFSRSTLFWWCVGFSFLLWCVFFGRLIWLQMIQSEVYAQLAERNRSLWVTVRAPRGRVLDRTGRVIADNTIAYGQTQVEGDLEREVPLSLEEALPRMATEPAKIRRSYHRRYPYGPILAQIVGYVQQPLFSTDVVTGRAGVERTLNGQLAGSDGSVRYEKNARGQAVRVLAQQEAQPGKDVTLTVDAELSKVAFEALGSQHGAIIVSNPQTGEVLAAVSTPSFYPQSSATEAELEPWKSFIEKGVVAKNIAEALEFPNNPFLFRPSSALYPPGSTFKIITALAGLEYDAIQSDTLVKDEGKLVVGEFEYGNWYWRQYGRVEGDINVVRALARSNDIFFYKAAEWIGPDRLAEFAKLFTFGQTTGFDLPGEKSGIVPSPTWKQQRFGEKWFLGNTYHMGIGQGDVLVTPLQVHEMMSAVASKGRRCAPRVMQSSPVSCQELSLSPESLELVWQGLRQACSTGGTAYPFFTAPYDMLCKTGTAEFGEANEEGHRPTHAWITAAVSKDPRREPDDPEFTPALVVTVLVESSAQQRFAEGSREAGEVAKRVIDWWWANQ